MCRRLNLVAGRLNARIERLTPQARTRRSALVLARTLKRVGPVYSLTSLLASKLIVKIADLGIGLTVSSRSREWPYRTADVRGSPPCFDFGRAAGTSAGSIPG